MTSALPYASYLRVYDPLAAFPPPERGQWAAYAASGAAPDPVSGIRREHQAALGALLASPPLPAAANVEHAFVRVQGGQVYVCPWRTQLRSWLALVEFCSALPGEMVAAFVPTAAVETVENDLEKWVAAHPDLHVHIRTSTWHVPLRWLFLFDAAERELVLDRRHRPGHEGVRRCLYVTAMAQARRRAARGLAVLRRAFSDGPVVAGVEDVARWLEEFHPHALVELDYGGLVQLMSDEELQADDSPALLAESLRALSAGDGAAAGAAYERVAERWRVLHARESAN